MSYCLDTLSVLNVNVAIDPVDTASINTNKMQITKHRVILLWFLRKSLVLCCPVLKPQIIGVPKFPGDTTLNVSLEQVPTAPAFFGVAAALRVVPVTGSAILKIWKI